MKCADKCGKKNFHRIFRLHNRLRFARVSCRQKIMNTFNNTTTTAAIKLNDTFTRLVSGAATMGDILTERREARAARLASEDAYARRHPAFVEAREQFFYTCAY